MCKSRLYKTDRVEVSVSEYHAGETYYPCVVERSDGQTVLAIFTGGQIRDAVDRAESRMEEGSPLSERLAKVFTKTPSAQ